VSNSIGTVRWEEDAWRSICNFGYKVLWRKNGVGVFETTKLRSPKVDRNHQLQREAWHLICNSRYKVLRRKNALECLKLINVEVPKWITIVDHKGMRGDQSVTLGMEYFGEKRHWNV
jgi:hypothetical protein